MYRNEPLPGKVDSAKIDSVLSRKLNIKQSHKDYRGNEPIPGKVDLIDVESISILHLTTNFIFLYRNELLPGTVDSAKIDGVLSSKVNIKQ